MIPLSSLRGAIEQLAISDRVRISNTNRDAPSSQMIGHSESTNHTSLTSVIERRVISTWSTELPGDEYHSLSSEYPNGER